MSQNPAHDPRLNVRGAVDLSGLGRPATPAPGTPGGLPTPGPYTVDVDTEGFPALVQSSTQHPVVVLLQRDGAFLFVKSDPDCHAKRPCAFPKSFLCSFLCV